MRILVVEDDDELAGLLALGLRNECYATDVATSHAEAVEHLLATDYDVACVDLGLPDGDGLDLCRRLHGEGPLRRPRRILILTGRDAVAQRVAGLDAGADDYLVKPFDLQELLARLRALHRRQDRPATVLRWDDIELDPRTRRTWRAGRPVPLTAREFALLRYFMHHPGEVLAAEELLEHVWDANADPLTTSVRVILSRLRKKLGPPSPIVTVTGAGYALRGGAAG
jgi:DNA-binding response OmpR family regulator